MPWPTRPGPYPLPDLEIGLQGSWFNRAPSPHYEGGQAVHDWDMSVPFTPEL